MRWYTVLGLATYCLIAGTGLLAKPGLAQAWLIAWMVGFLFLAAEVAYESYVSSHPVRPFPFIVLGIVLLNFLIMISGGQSLRWPVFFLFAVPVAAFSPPPRTYVMLLLILAIETANYLHPFGVPRHAERWHVFAGFGLSLAVVSAAASHILQRTRREAESARRDRDQLLAHAEAVDPLTAPGGLESLAPGHRQATHIRSVMEREIDFNGLIDMIYGFVPANTYALFLREPRDSDVFVLAALRTGQEDHVLPVGTVLDPERKVLVHICAEQRQIQYLSDLAGLSMPLVNLGYYRSDIEDPPVRSFLVLPIVKEDQTIAVLAVDSLEPGAFSLETQDMLEKFSPFFVQIIDKIDLTLALQARAKVFKGLHDISTELNKSLWFGETMRAVLPRLHEIVPYDLCACVLADGQEGRETFTVASLAGYDESLLGRTFEIEESPILTFMRKHWSDRGILQYYDGNCGARGRDMVLLPFKEFQRRIRSLYGRLLVANGKLQGAVFLSSLSPDAFDDMQRETLLDTLMNQISQGAYNALLYQRIENMARTDGLTGLLNHRTFMEKLRERYRELERNPRPFSVLLMDIDKFKNVNDKYGHPVGDLAIKAVAKVLSGIIRGSDFVARYGGEEFAVGMVDTDAKGAAQTAERVRRSMESTVITRVADGELKVTISIGVAAFPEDTKDRENLVTLADEALYQAKRTGRNRVCLSREARREQAAART